MNPSELLRGRVLKHVAGLEGRFGRLAGPKPPAMGSCIRLAQLHLKRCSCRAIRFFIERLTTAETAPE
jgi:hypothetical protein